jgi:hypothetical protein
MQVDDGVHVKMEEASSHSKASSSALDAGEEDVNAGWARQRAEELKLRDVALVGCVRSVRVLWCVVVASWVASWVGLRRGCVVGFE